MQTWCSIAQLSLGWLRANLGQPQRIVAVPGGKLFFVEEHPRLMATLLQDFWGGLPQIRLSAR